MFLTNASSFLLDSILTITHPQSCAICNGVVERRIFGVVCQSCWHETRLFTGEDALCWKCGSLQGAVAVQHREYLRCHRCDDQSFTVARACGEYAGALRASVLALKLQAHLPVYLVQQLTGLCKLEPLSGATRIMPVPLHPERQRIRGFNQAAVISRALSKSLALPIDHVSLVRTAPSSKYRAGLDAKGRRETVANAFQVVFPKLVERERILLVDDVFTTGATVSSCATALLEAGVSEVLVVTIARAS